MRAEHAAAEAEVGALRGVVAGNAASPPVLVVAVGEVGDAALLPVAHGGGHVEGRPAWHSELDAVLQGEVGAALGLDQGPGPRGGVGLEVDGDSAALVEGGVLAVALVCVVLAGGGGRDRAVRGVVPRAPPAAIPGLPLPLLAGALTGR